MRIHPDKKHFTKAERIVVRTLQQLHISFQTKVKIGGREIDFLIGKYAIEIDGHSQDGSKNQLLVELGYIPVHFTNQEIYKDRNILIKFL